MAPEDTEIGIQEEIGKLRSAILRTIIELDRFCDTVRKARDAVEEMRLVGEQPTEAVPEQGGTSHHEHSTGHAQGEDKWYDTHADD